MKGHLAKTALIIFCISFFHLFSIHEARSEDPGLKAGGFQWGGDIELGYRFKDIDGNKNRYKETVNLEDGLRLFDFNLLGKSLEPGKGMVDYFSLRVRDIGDPFPAARLEIKKNKTYDFVATYKEYKYWFDREDNGFFTDNHNFSQKTRRGTLTLSVFPKDDVRVTAGYSYTGRDGDAGIPGLNIPFAMDQDLNERMHDFFVSADFPVANWDFHVKQEYWNYKNKDRIEGALFEKRNDQINTYVSTVKAHTKFGERLDLDTGYVFAHSGGDAHLTTIPEIGVNSGKGDFNYNTHIFELGLSYLLMSKLIAHFDYRFHTIDQDGHANTDLLVSAPANTHTKFNQSAHTGTIQLEYLPRDNLTLRAGYRFQFRDTEANDFVVNQFDGGKRPTDTNSWTHGWIASADWKPFKFLTFYGEYQGANFDNPYTWISPQSENIGRFKVKYDTPVENLSLKGTFQWRRKRNPDQNFAVDTQDYSIAATYQPSFIPGLSIDGSFTYEKLLDKKDVFNVIPFSFETFYFDSSAQIYSGGISYEGIYKGLGARVNGSYAKTMGENPQRYADLALSFWYKNKWVTPILTLERTYLHDHVKRHDSFDANLLTFSLRKDF